VEKESSDHRSIVSAKLVIFQTCWPSFCI
jgi:hypothetical protein